MITLKQHVLEFVDDNSGGVKFLHLITEVLRCAFDDGSVIEHKEKIRSMDPIDFTRFLLETIEGIDELKVLVYVHRLTEDHLREKMFVYRWK